MAIDVIAPLALPSHNTQLDNHEEKFMTTQKTGAQAQTRDASPEQQPVREQIEERAYYHYLERGRSDGHALDDWLTAEAELRQNKESLSV
jgi:hypothetical protein